MNEVDMQALVVKAINEKGGFSRKLSHRFLVGVVDLLVKLPDKDNAPAGVFEAKRWDWVPLHTGDDHVFALDVTGPQKNFLRSAAKAGMPAGVISFIQEKYRGLRGIAMAVYTLKEAEARQFRAMPKDHADIGDHTRRDEIIYQNIRLFYSRWRNEQ